MSTFRIAARSTLLASTLTVGPLTAQAQSMADYFSAPLSVVADNKACEFPVTDVSGDPQHPLKLQKVIYFSAKGNFEKHSLLAGDLLLFYTDSKLSDGAKEPLSAIVRLREGGSSHLAGNRKFADRAAGEMVKIKPTPEDFRTRCKIELEKLASTLPQRKPEPLVRKSLTLTFPPSQPAITPGS